MYKRRKWADINDLKETDERGPKVQLESVCKRRKGDLNMNIPDQNSNKMFGESSRPFGIGTENKPNDMVNTSLDPGSNLLFPTQPPQPYLVYPAFVIPAPNDPYYLSHGVCEHFRPKNMVNFSAPLSTHPLCADLPFSDLTTLQFFYNLGLKYFHEMNALQNRRFMQPSISRSNSGLHRMDGQNPWTPKNDILKRS